MPEFRVLYITDWFAPILSGVVTSVRTAIAWLSATLGAAIIQIAPEVRGYVDRFQFRVARTPSIKFKQFGVPHCAFFLPRYKKRLLKMVEEERINLVHLQAAYFLSALGIWVAKRLDLPIVTTFHTDPTLTFPEAMGRLEPRLFGWRPVVSVLRRILRPILVNTEQFVAPSKFSQERLLALGVDPEKITVIPTAIKAPANLPSRQEARKKLGLPQGKKIELYLGRVAGDKNLKMLVQSFRIVAKEDPDTILMIVGGGFHHVVLRRMARQYDIAERMIFVPEVPYEDIWWYYRACDVYVFPSNLEQQGLTCAEAGAAARPVVAVNSGGVPETVKDGLHGYLVEDDAEAFASATLKLLRNANKRISMGQCFRHHIKATLHPDIVYPALAMLYRRVLDEHAARAA